jgi:hypothetical protein
VVWWTTAVVLDWRDVVEISDFRGAGEGYRKSQTRIDQSKVVMGDNAGNKEVAVARRIGQAVRTKTGICACNATK